MIHSIDNKDGSPWLTMTAETLDEWRFLEKMYWDILDVDESQGVMIEKDDGGRQITMRISKPRCRHEEEEYYCG